MASKIDIVIQAVDNLSATMQKIEANVKRTTTQINNSMKGIQSSSQQTADATVSNVNRMNTAFGELSTNVRRIGALVGSFYAVRSAVAAVATLSEDFKDLNANMAYVNTIAQLTDEQLKNLTLDVEDLSVSLGKAAPELARGLYDVYSSGFTGAEAMKVLEVSTKGAIAGLTTTAVAARGLMAIMNAYNRKTGADAVDIMDVMFKIVDKGVITFEELATQIGSVVTVSSQLGIPFEDVGAAMAQMTLRGIDAAESATALEGLMRSIMKPSDQAKEAIKKLNEQQKGLNFQWDVATLRAKGLKGIMEDLAKATQGNYEVMGAIIPEIRGMRSALVLASEGGAGFTEMQKEMRDHVNATQKAFEEANKSITRQLEDINAEWDDYKRKAGEALANVELALMKSLVSFASWIEKNKDTILAIIGVIKELTIVFLSYKAVMIAIAGFDNIFGWFARVQASVIAVNTTMGAGITTATAFKVALMSLTTPIVITLAIAGFALVMYQIQQLKRELLSVEQTREETINMISQNVTQTQQKTLADIAVLNTVISNAQKSNDVKTISQAKELQDNLYNLKKLYTQKDAKLLDDSGDRNVTEINRQIDETKKAIEKGQKSLEASGKLTGGLSLMPAAKPTGITTPEYAASSTTEELLGPDDALTKIAEKIAKVKKEISDFYGKIGDFSNDFKKELEDQADSLSDLGLKFNRYLEDTNIELTRLEEKHKETISSIENDISSENTKFNESMDDRLSKFNDTMNEMATSHADKTADLQHDIDLEVGMGLRADKEKLADLRLRLARENRDYADKVADDTAQKNLEDTRDKRDNAEKLKDYQLRLEQEKRDYQQKVDDISKELDREEFDYADQQNNILKKTQETLQGIVSAYQKAFDSVYDSIIESGVPALLTQLPTLTQTAIQNSIKNVQIPRNLMAEQEYVKNWGGKYGRLPSAEEISMGVYGTATGPNTEAGVNITINNPVVNNQDTINSLIQQLNRAIAQGQVLAKSGAY
jgi:TP901 family phage tail tape measure protein